MPLWRELEFLRFICRSSRSGSRIGFAYQIAADPEPLGRPRPSHAAATDRRVRGAARPGQSEEAVTIDVSATANDGPLSLVVSDDGPGLPPARAGETGIGLSNTRNRLARLYPVTPACSSSPLRREECA